MAPIGDGTIARAIARGLKERFPIGGAILETLGPEAIRAISGQHDPDPEKMAARLETAAKQAPVLVNNLNLESPLQSGTTLGMAGALLTSAGALWGMVSAGNFDPAIMGPLIASVLASAWGLWRRWGSGLKPLFGRK